MISCQVEDAGIARICVSAAIGVAEMQVR